MIVCVNVCVTEEEERARTVEWVVRRACSYSVLCAAIFRVSPFVCLLWSGDTTTHEECRPTVANVLRNACQRAYFVNSYIVKNVKGIEA